MQKYLFLGVSFGLSIPAAAQDRPDTEITVTATGVYFIPPPDENGQTAIMVLDPRTGFQKRIAPVDGRPMWGLAVSPDRRSMLHVAVEARPESDLMLVTRFQ